MELEILEHLEPMSLEDAVAVLGEGELPETERKRLDPEAAQAVFGNAMGRSSGGKTEKPDEN
ncbi:MAG: hypothetical protein IJ087_00390 [Eggerthellaceae bacterium]|nr:hypothetical protein [Eggerthellaceae bacterium]